MNRPIRVKTPGTILRIAMDITGLIYTVSVDEQRNWQLTSTSENGSTNWSINLPSRSNPLRLSTDGTVWIGLHKELRQFESNGVRLQIVKLPCQDGEQLGSFLITREGLVCSLQPNLDGEGSPRVISIDFEGDLLWSTTISPGLIAFEGMAVIGIHTGWKPQPMKPWTPENWVADFHQGLLLSGNYLLAGFAENPRSGIGRVYCLDYNNGNLLWMTEPLPIGTKAIAGNGLFLIGVPGYGAFDTYLYDKSGTILKHWSSHGYYLITEDSEIRTVEVGDTLPSKMHFSIFKPDGSVQKGPHLPSHNTTYPVIDKDDTAVFWRSGELISIDKHLKKNTLYTDNTIRDLALLSRMMLTKQGKLVFAIDSELWIFDTNLKPLAKSCWPCDEANLQGNPVIQE